MTTYADLVEALRRGRVRGAKGFFPALTSSELDLLAVPYYDLGGIFVKSHPAAMDDETWRDYKTATEGPVTFYLARDIAVGFLWEHCGELIQVIVMWPYGEILDDDPTPKSAVPGYVFLNQEWLGAKLAARQTLVVALMMIEDAELNVEYVERPEARTDSVNRGRAKANLQPIPATRVISLSKIRKTYTGPQQHRPHQGGTHARPREHVRVLRELEIKPKGRKPYTRKAKTITINAGLTRYSETRVVQ